jgi:hypothetical protein
MTPDRTLIPLASELIGVVRDYSPADVAAVLARVPDDKRDALVVLLAAMVDPDARPSQLLAWTRLGPVPSRPFVPAGYSLRSLPRRLWAAARNGAWRSVACRISA